ncbi:MAG: 30S ribosomal protein S2 [Armatimonadetes bacterium]|nr:30S ribosomal protein S2 [Armatimonadota bacterium]
MAQITMKELLEAGVHFGHHTRRWNPKMKKHIYGARNGIYIIDLHQTMEMFNTAVNFIKETINEGGHILFVGTKKQAQEAIREAAKKSHQYYVTHRWLGGTLTNYKTIQSRIRRLKELERMKNEGEFESLPRKEASKLNKELEKLERNLGGIKDMPGMPAALFLVDLKQEHTAALEARRLQIPTVGIVDTNCDPADVNFPIPGNDDAIRSIRLISGRIADTIVEEKQMEWQDDEIPIELPEIEEEAPLPEDQVAEYGRLFGEDIPTDKPKASKSKAKSIGKDDEEPSAKGVEDEFDLARKFGFADEE